MGIYVDKKNAEAQGFDREIDEGKKCANGSNVPGESTSEERAHTIEQRIASVGEGCSTARRIWTIAAAPASK